MTLEMIEKRNTFALKSIQNETQLIYANLEAFVYILNNLGNSEYQGSTEVSFSFHFSRKTKFESLVEQCVEIVRLESLTIGSKLCE